MRHNKKNKTIYYDNAVIKIYDLPIFYIPKLSHPDPSVERRSGFLPPSFSDTKNLGAGLEIPYFWNLDKDKDFTLKVDCLHLSILYLLVSIVKHLKISTLILNLVLQKDIKIQMILKKVETNLIFSQFVKKFKGEKGSDNEFKLSLQKVSNKKYLKLYKIKNNLVDYQNNILENSFNFSHEYDRSIFLVLKQF